MNEIVKFEENGQVVQFGAEDVKQRLCPNIDDNELALVMALCQAQKLNPFTKDVYVIKYGNSPASIVTSKEVFTKRANAHPDYEGFEAGVTFIDRVGNVSQREGSAVYSEAGEKLVGGWCRVFVKGRRPFYDEVTMGEYSTGKSGWAKMPATMIRKVALVHCLREAFPDDFQGLYGQEEMDAKIEQDQARAERQGANNAPFVQAPNKSGKRYAGNADSCATACETTTPIEAVAEVMASDDQLQDLAALVESFALMRGKTAEDVKCAVYASKSAQAAGIQPGAEMTAYQCETVCNVLSSWIEKAQAEQITQDFETKAARSMIASGELMNARSMADAIINDEM